jgi:hypothetical protein
MVLFEIISLVIDSFDRGKTIREIVEDQMGDFLTLVGDTNFAAAIQHINNSRIADHSPEAELVLAVGDLEDAYQAYLKAARERLIDRILLSRFIPTLSKRMERYEKMCSCALCLSMLYKRLDQTQLLEEYLKKTVGTFQIYISLDAKITEPSGTLADGVWFPPSGDTMDLWRNRVEQQILSFYSALKSLFGDDVDIDQIFGV